jgi:hypothetical protein
MTVVLGVSFDARCTHLGGVRACAPVSFAHLEPSYNEWRRRHPGIGFPLGAGLHCPVFWVINLDTDLAGTA